MVVSYINLLNLYIQGEILAALVGPAAFTGSMYADVESVDVRLEYVMYGPDVDVVSSIIIIMIKPFFFQR